MKNPQKIKQSKKIRRHKRVRAKIRGTAKRPRFSVFRSNRYIFAQLIDDEKGRTLVSISSRQLMTENKGTEAKKQKVISSPSSPKKDSKLKIQTQDEKIKKELSGKIKIAFQVGELIAQKALEKKIKQVIFDRGGYKYHGRVKAVAEGAREAGLTF